MGGSAIIQPGNEVWFHDHGPDEACTPNCYRHEAAAVVNAAVVLPFVDLHGSLEQVEPLTKPHYEKAEVLVRVLSDGSVLTVHDAQIVWKSE